MDDREICKERLPGDRRAFDYSGNSIYPNLEHSLTAGVICAMLCGCCEAESKAAQIKWVFMWQYLIAI